MQHKVVVYYDRNLTYPKGLKNLTSIFKGVNFILKNLHMKDEKNPFSNFLTKGDIVIIKPNFVATTAHHFELNTKRQICTTTHRSLLIPFIEYAFRAIGSNGDIFIVDSPIEAADFNAILRKLGIVEIVEYYKKRGYSIKLLDLRESRIIPIKMISNWKFGNRSFNVGLFIRKKLKGDPLGYTIVDLGSKSYFHQYSKLSKLRFYKPYYKEPLKAHDEHRHCYYIPNTILRAKLIVNIAKMKTHRIAGVTLSLKNCIGLVSKKMWLPHYTEGHYPDGDQYREPPSLINRIEHFLRVVPLLNGISLFIRFPKIDDRYQKVVSTIYDGKWIGNDTLWRTILDVAHIIQFADKNGKIQEKAQRTILSILDGIVAGEGDGPLEATPKHCGILMGSFDMHSLDIVATKMMGFNTEKIKYLKHALTNNIKIIQNVNYIPQYNFTPPLGWEDLVKK